MNPYNWIASSKRMLAIVYLILLYIVISTVITYVLKSFVIFCVVYTLHDCYKKRRRFVWLFRLAMRNTQFVVYALVGDELYNALYSIYVTGVKPQKKLKKKI